MSEPPIPPLVEFQVPDGVRLVFRWGAAGDLEAALRELGVEKPLLVSDERLAQTGAWPRLLAGLEPGRLKVSVHLRPVGEPTVDSIASGIADYRAGRCDGLIAFGGGSVIDAAKAVGILAASGSDDPLAFRTDGPRAVPEPPPLVALPTTAGSGSEVTGMCLLIDEPASRKVLIRSPFLRPKIALVDPELTVSMPSETTVSSGVDAFCHAVECFTKDRLHPYADALAIESARLVFGALPRGVQNPGDRSARQDLAAAAALAGLAFDAGGLQFHALAHVLGARFHLPHGLACGLVLPGGLRSIRNRSVSKLTRLATALNVETDTHDVETAQRVIQTVSDWLDHLNIPKILEVTGLTEQNIPWLVHETRANAARPIDTEQTAAIWDDLLKPGD